MIEGSLSPRWPVGADSLFSFLGITDATETERARAEDAVEVVRMYVWAYVRGNGFTGYDEPNRPLAAVIHSGAARLYSNPEQERQHTAGAVSVAPSVMAGFTLAELAVLNRYRRRAL